MAALKFPFVSQPETVLKSHYLTLSNDGNLGPNIASSFISRIINPIHLNGDYDVGLEEIRYFEKQPLVPPPAPAASTKPLFPNLKKTEIRQIHLIKSTTMFRTFLTLLNRDLEVAKFPLTFVMWQYTQGRVLVTAIGKPTNVPTNIEIPENFARALGFNRKTFGAGRYPAQRLTNQELFNQIPLGTKWTVTEEKLHDDQNLIQLKQNMDSLRIFEKQAQDKTVNQFITRMNQDMNQNPLSFSVLIPLPDSNKYGLKYEGGEYDYLRIPEKLASALGFSNAVFKNGEYWSTEDFNMEAYDKIEIGEPLFFMSSFPFTIYQPMNEPKDRRVFTVLDEINKTLKTRFMLDQPVEFKIAEEASIGLANVTLEHLTVTLPPPIVEYFFDLEGIDYEFEKVEKLPIYDLGKVKQVYEYYLKLTNHFPEIIKKETPTRLLVTVDCAENQMYGNRMVPVILETSLSSEYKKSTVIKSNPILFVPCSSKHIDFIRVELLDEYLQPHQFGTSKTVVKLILRPRGQVL